MFLSIHNLTFYRSLITRMRHAILENRFDALYREESGLLAGTDIEYPTSPS
jgi:queuine/archaeosine tRNA-ribosyltransferase